MTDATEEAGIRYALTTHESAAAMMGCATAELTGIPGVVATAISPGVTNGKPRYIGKREAAIMAWYGDDLETKSLFDLTGK